jgi:hypothetical protein
MKKILLLLFLIVLAALLATKYYTKYFTYGTFQKTSLTPEGIASLRKEMAGMIKSMGPEAAYAAVKERYRAADEAIEPHNGAHLFGEVLYDFGGYENIRYCDDTYEWGCYHGIFTRAMQDVGIAAIEKFFLTCKELTGKNLLGCQHGVGHALGQYFLPSELVHQLDICNEHGWYGPLGCGGGVFMEYNLSHFFGSGASNATPRAANPQDPFYPCFDIPKNYTSGCVYRLGEWWLEYIKGDLAQADGYCDKLPSADLREYCWLGLGQAVTDHFNGDVESIIADCDKLKTYASKLYCRVGAAWALRLADDEQSVHRVCTGYNTCVDDVGQAQRKLGI